LPSEVPKRRPGQRIVNWFLQSAQLERAREFASSLSAEQSEYLRRAKLAHEMATLMKASRSALRAGSTLPHASNAFRESIHWVLLSHGVGDAQMQPATLWAAADQKWLAGMAAESADLTELRQAMAATFVEFAADSPERQAATNERLERFSKRLLFEVEAPRRALESARRKRSRRLLLLAMPALAMFAFASAHVLWPTDLAKGKPWRTSSTFDVCHPKELVCAGTATDIFFHTKVENEPWIEYDFGTPLAFSSLTVKNRLDYGLERAVPLVAEVSDDGKAYREVARRADWFATWRPHFPTQHARYLRLRVLRSSALHLVSVAVHP